ncbi:MAG: hypothetical protein AAGF47_12570, partial [Planctomycetota bacterium]
MHSGRGVGAIAAAFDMQGMYTDGGNLYGYLGSNPWTRSDVLGLSWDPFDDMDRIVAEMTGARAAFAQSLGRDAVAAGLVAANIMTFLPFPGTAVLGELAKAALGGQSMRMALLNSATGLVPGGKLLGKLGSWLGGVGTSAWSAAKHYAGKTGVLRGRGSNNLVDRAGDFLDRKPGLACGCFAAGTMVWTAFGQVPIEHITPGTLVWSQDEDGSGGYGLSVVT